MRCTSIRSAIRVTPTPLLRARSLTPPVVSHGLTRGQGFQAHLWDAISSNWQRKAIYAAQSQGASNELSRDLIVGELLSLPVALWFDFRARHFQACGIPVISADFVSMKRIKAPDTPPIYRNVASDRSFARLKTSINAYRQHLKRLLARHDFQGAAAATYTLLVSIEAREVADGCHYAMYRHLVESVGIAALHAAQYAQASRGTSNALVASFITVQAMALDFAEGIDRKAQALHRQGVGIVVNDVPDIPFKREFEATNRANLAPSARMSRSPLLNGHQGHPEGANGF